MSAAMLLARQPGPAYTVGFGAPRRVHLYRLYQTRTYEGALPACGGREGSRRIIENAFAFARQRLKFRGLPQLLPVPAVAREAGECLPDVLCIGEFVWGRPVRDPAKPCSSATLVWFQEQFAPPISEAALQDLREIDWASIAQDWDW
jgi:hypothetical protein